MTTYRHLITTPYGIRWVVHRQHTESDVLALAEHLLDIRQSDVQKHAFIGTDHSPLNLLTTRQKQVIKLVSQGTSPRISDLSWHQYWEGIIQTASDNSARSAGGTHYNPDAIHRWFSWHD